MTDKRGAGSRKAFVLKAQTGGLGALTTQRPWTTEQIDFAGQKYIAAPSTVRYADLVTNLRRNGKHA